MKTAFLLLFLVTTTFSFSQSENITSRKIQRFENTQKDLIKICDIKNEFRDSVFQLVENNRLMLSPNCPLSILNSEIQENRSNLIENWYINYPSEYKLYVEFLEKLIRSNILQS